MGTQLAGHVNDMEIPMAIYIERDTTTKCRWMRDVGGPRMENRTKLDDVVFGHELMSEKGKNPRIQIMSKDTFHHSCHVLHCCHDDVCLSVCMYSLCPVQSTIRQFKSMDLV